MSFARPYPQSVFDVLRFWRCHRDDWFSHDRQFDQRFARPFNALHRQAASGALKGWKDTPDGLLALLILLDQYPRNAFCGTAQMYAHDATARRIATRMLKWDLIRQVPKDLQLFCLLPFAHSEHFADQELSVAVHREFLPSGLDRARRHRRIIGRFGRFPHRNAILGRRSRVDEIGYLQKGGFQG